MPADERGCYKSDATQPQETKDHARLRNRADRQGPAAPAHRAARAKPARQAQRHRRDHARRDTPRGRMGRGRRRGARDRGRRRGPGLLRWLRPGRLRRGPRARRAGRSPLPPGEDALGPDARLRRHEAQHRRLHGAMAQPQAHHRQGAWLCGGRRQRHRAVLRPAGHGRRRAHRLHAHARMGLPDHSDVASRACRARTS